MCQTWHFSLFPLLLFEGTLRSSIHSFLVEGGLNVSLPISVDVSTQVLDCDYKDVIVFCFPISPGFPVFFRVSSCHDEYIVKPGGVFESQYFPGRLLVQLAIHKTIL